VLSFTPVEEQTLSAVNSLQLAFNNSPSEEVSFQVITLLLQNKVTPDVQVKSGTLKKAFTLLKLVILPLQISICIEFHSDILFQFLSKSLFHFQAIGEIFQLADILKE